MKTKEERCNALRVARDKHPFDPNILLKPCKFCDSDEKPYCGFYPPGSGGAIWCVVCLSATFGNIQQDVIDSWNGIEVPYRE